MIPAAALQERFLHLRENKIFETFVIVVIVLSALVIGAKTYAIPEEEAWKFYLGAFAYPVTEHRFSFHQCSAEKLNAE